MHFFKYYFCTWESLNFSVYFYSFFEENVRIKHLSLSQQRGILRCMLHRSWIKSSKKDEQFSISDIHALPFCWFHPALHPGGQRGYFSRLPAFSYQLESLVGKLIWLFQTSMYPTFTCAIRRPDSAGGIWPACSEILINRNSTPVCRLQTGAVLLRSSTANRPPSF